MAFKRLSMRKIHRVLRLSFEAGLSIRAIARSIQASPSTVGDYIRRARTAGLSWPLPEGLDERALEARLFPCAEVSARVERAIPDWTRVHTERRRPGVTLALLWEEYKAEHPQGLQYSQFCERYRVCAPPPSARLSRAWHARAPSAPPGAGWANAAPWVSCWAWTSQRWDQCACIAPPMR